MDGGATWTSLSPNQDHEGTVGNTIFGQLPFDFTVTQIALATNQGTFKADSAFPNVVDIGANNYDPNTIYVLGFSETTGVPGLFVTKDHGATWVQTNGGLPLSVSGSITVDPRNRDTVYYTVPTAGGTGTPRVWVTTNAGVSWAAVSTGLPDVPTWTLVVDPRTGNLYVGNDEGVFVSTNQGGSWQRFGIGMPNVQVRDLVLNQNLNTLTAATYGRSMFQLFLENSQANAGAITAVTGSNVWTGPITLTGSSPGATVQIGAGGSQALQNGITTAQLILAGPISDATQGGDYQLVKVGLGDVALGGANTYGGLTHVEVGNLITQNSTALGNSNSAEIQAVAVSGSSGSFTLTFNGSTTSSLSFTTPSTVVLPEVQTVSLGGSTAGTFTLTFNGQTTSALAFNATAAAVQSALNNLTTIGGVGGSVIVGLASGLYTVTFGGSLAGTNEPQLVGAGTGGATPTVSTITNGASSATAVQNALNALSTVGGTGGTATVVQNGNIFTIVFGGSLANTNLPQMTSSASAGTTVVASTVVDGGVGTLVDPGAALELASNLQGEAITLQGDGIPFDGHNTGTLRNIAGNNTFTGTLTLFSTVTSPTPNVTIGVNSGTQLTIGTSPILSGTGTITDGTLKVNLTKELTGTLILADADSYHGSTFVNQGVLQIQNAASLGVTTTGGTTVLDGTSCKSRRRPAGR